MNTVTLDTEAVASASLAISEKIQPMLRGLGPDVQGAVLADLVSLWLAGHNPKIRNRSLRVWLIHMEKLIDASEKQIIERLGRDPWAKEEET